MKKKGTVFVGLSGGVDSAVSAALLQKSGYEVVGVFMRTWHPDFLECNEEEERRDAMRVAARLNIPFLTFDLEDVYKREVADYMIREYRAGRTPNPDAMCNKEVKFGAFLNKALSMGADYVATGHYAQVAGANSKNSSDVSLLKGIDPAKDQSYFLWTLTQKELTKVIFPVGGLKKSEVRALAKKLGLSVAGKKDSQGICFLGPVDLKEFLKHYIKEKKGKVLAKDGRVIGYHDGATFHTLGERHGFTITKKTPNDRPYYIVGKDVKKNILYVSQNPNAKDSVKQNSDFAVYLEDCNWISGAPEKSKRYLAQVRYHGELLPCRVEARPKSKTVRLIFEHSVLVASGQSAVVYDGRVCLGGGTVV